MRSPDSSQRVSPRANSTSPSVAVQTTWCAQPLGVAGVDEAAQLVEPAEELAASAIVARRPLDRELHVLGHELQRAVRVGPVEALEVLLEEASGHHPRSLGTVGRDADHRQRPLLEEVGDRLQAMDAVRPVPLPDAVVEPEERRGSSRRGSASGTTPARIAPARKLAQANSSSRARARAARRASSSRGDDSANGEKALLGDENAVAHDLVLGQVEAVVQHGRERLERVRRLRGDRGEAALEVLDGLFHDHVEAVLLGLEVVVERRRADADVRGDVGPLRVLVAVAAEALRRGGEDARCASCRPDVRASCATTPRVREI